MVSNHYKNKELMLDDLLSKDDEVLDVGFWGQGVSIDDENWPHKLLKNRIDSVYGIDIVYDENRLDDKSHYFKQSAEDFKVDKKFDVIFGGDLIEHLSNPGLFLNCSAEHLKENGRVILTTPNAFNVFTIAGKIMNREPVVNHDHTCYFNSKTINTLCEKNGFEVENISYIYSLGVDYKESYKKKLLNCIYKFLSFFTDKYYETMVVVAVPKVKTKK